MQIPKNHFCPSCKSTDLSIFYTAKNVPVNSCLMFSNYKDAIAFPKDDVILAFCKSCGFIFNITFNPSRLDYSTLIPEEQGFSKTFKIFAERLANRLIKTYNIYRKNILEIGCGRGDFLVLLCKLGKNNGVGIDPSPVTGKIQKSDLKNLTFIRDFFSEKYSDYVNDLVCCRHTLEHINNTAKFINTLRNSIGNNFKNTCFFEVPDTYRILTEIAFWDIYYEHCSYFTLGSLARLFRLSNFEVVNLMKDYFDQYLLIDIKPCGELSNRIFSNEETVDELANAVNHFSIKCAEKIFDWKTKLNHIKKYDKKAIVWGSGSKCVAFMTTLAVKDEIEYIVDINPNRHGKFIPGVGKQIISPEYLRKYKPDIVIVMNPAYCNEIKQSIDDMGLNPEIIPCL